MANIVFDGLEKYIKQLEDLGDKSHDMMKEAVYPAAGFMIEKIKDKIESLPSTDVRYSNFQRKMHHQQKKGLLQSIGLAKMQDTEFGVNTKIGFDGYNVLKSKKYPDGQPNVMIARVVESGSTYQKKQPFIRPTINAYKKEAEKMIEKNLDEKIKEVMK